jgi:hypothetical protein
MRDESRWLRMRQNDEDDERGSHAEQFRVPRGFLANRLVRSVYDLMQQVTLRSNLRGVGWAGAEALRQVVCNTIYGDATRDIATGATAHTVSDHPNPTFIQNGKGVLIRGSNTSPIGDPNPVPNVIGMWQPVCRHLSMEATCMAQSSADDAAWDHLDGVTKTPGGFRCMVTAGLSMLGVCPSHPSSRERRGR